MKSDSTEKVGENEGLLPIGSNDLPDDQPDANEYRAKHGVEPLKGQHFNPTLYEIAFLQHRP